MSVYLLGYVFKTVNFLIFNLFSVNDKEIVAVSVKCIVFDDELFNSGNRNRAL